jgi:23S rRNA pseudouridine2605 synthase
VYYVTLRGELSAAVMERLRRGVWLAEGRTGPVHVRVLKRSHVLTIAEVMVREGMNREVRRVFAKFGVKVKRLKRIRIGDVELGSLRPGEWRTLGRSEVEGLRKLAVQRGRRTS